MNSIVSEYSLEYYCLDYPNTIVNVFSITDLSFDA